MQAFEYQGLVFGGTKKAVEEGYITLKDFPVPVVLPQSRVYVVRGPLYIPMEPFNIPLLDTSDEFSDWLENSGRETLLPVLLNLATAYASSDQGRNEAQRGISQVFGL